MKHLITILILILTNLFVHGQSIEQIALDFYAQNILTQTKGVKVSYDGKINNLNGNYKKYANELANYYFMCKARPRAANNDGIKYSSDIFYEIDEIIVLDSIESTTNQEILDLPKPIKNKKLKGGYLRHYWKRLKYLVFPVKFNLNIEPYIQLENDYLVWIKSTKLDSGYGDWYFIRVSKDKKVIDWCQTSWIQ